jgi:hypothetical protein
MSRLKMAVAYAACYFSRPKRGDLWTCSKCGTQNEPDRGSCMNGCR